MSVPEPYLTLTVSIVSIGVPAFTVSCDRCDIPTEPGSSDWFFATIEGVAAMVAEHPEREHSGFYKFVAVSDPSNLLPDVPVGFRAWPPKETAAARVTAYLDELDRLDVVLGNAGMVLIDDEIAPAPASGVNELTRSDLREILAERASLKRGGSVPD